MVKFDYKTFLELSGKVGSPAQAIGTAFGMPSCLINLGVDALSLMPSQVLKTIRTASANGINRADDVVKSAFSWIRLDSGFLEYDTEDGTIRWVSSSSKNGIDRNEGGALKGISAFTAALAEAAGAAGRLYNNYQTAVGRINSIRDCIENYQNFLKYSGSNAIDERMRLAGISPEKYQELVDQQYGFAKEDLEEAVKFREDASQLMKRIDDIIAKRVSNPALEPEFNSDYAPILSGVPFNISKPIPQVETPTVFRLAYSPPKTLKGKYLLTRDGIYFDSRNGITAALLEIESNRNKLRKSTYWKFDFAPNIGGKGTQVSVNDIKLYVNTILDESIIDDSHQMKTYYDKDQLLNELEGNRNRRTYDLSTTIQSLESSGVSIAVIKNMEQSLISEAAYFNNQIKKRKKQIELAVKLPVIYGKGSLFAPGQIPINDFSYLNGINYHLDIAKQKKLIFDNANVSSVVLPLNYTLSTKINNLSDETLDHLLLSNVGIGDIITDKEFGSTDLSITPEVVENGLICLYNYTTIG